MEVVTIHRRQVAADIQQEGALPQLADGLSIPIETVGRRLSHRQVGRPRHQVGPTVTDHTSGILSELRCQLRFVLNHHAQRDVTTPCGCQVVIKVGNLDVLKIIQEEAHFSRLAGI